MVVLGIVLIVLAVLVGLGVSVSSSDSTTLEVFGVEFGVVVPTVFFLGAAAGVALILGLWLTKKGLSRGYRRHKEVKELRQQVEASPGSAPAASAERSGDFGATDRSDQQADHGHSHAPGQGTGHATDPSTPESKDRADRLATEPYTVADGTERSPAAQHRPASD